MAPAGWSGSSSPRVPTRRTRRGQPDDGLSPGIAKWHGGPLRRWPAIPETFRLALARVEGQLLGLGGGARGSRRPILGPQDCDYRHSQAADAGRPDLYLPERQGCIIRQAIEAER